MYLYLYLYLYLYQRLIDDCPQGVDSNAESGCAEGPNRPDLISRHPFHKHFPIVSRTRTRRGWGEGGSPVPGRHFFLG